MAAIEPRPNSQKMPMITDAMARPLVSSSGDPLASSPDTVRRSSPGSVKQG
jgi:hypothetical protein